MENESRKKIPAQIAKRLSLLCASERRKDKKNRAVMNMSVSLLRYISHPVAVAQYTFTHNTQNNTINLGKVRAVPRLVSYTLAFALQLWIKREKTCQGSKTSVRVVK